MKWIFYLVLMITAWRLSHYFFLWMEAKGWIYYKKRPSGGGNALIEIQSYIGGPPKKVYEITKSDSKIITAKSKDEKIEL